MDIDRLDIIISAEASKVEKQLNKLMACLNKLSGVLGGLNTSGLSDLSDGVAKLSVAMRLMNGIQTKDLSRLSRNLEKLFEAAKGVNSVNTTGLLDLASSMRILGGVDAKSIDSISGILGKLSGLKADNLPQVSEGLKKAVDAIGALSAVSFDSNNLRNVINSLGRLLKADFGKFNSEQFKEVVATISALSGLPDISRSVNQLVSSLAKLTNAGDKSGLTASSLPILVDTLKAAVSELAKMPDISTPVNSLISSMARLSNAGKKTGETADGLEKLAKETIKFFEVMQTAPRISNNTLRMTEALSRLASAGDKLGSSTSQVTNVFNKIFGLSKKAELQINKAAKSIIASFKGIGNASSSLRTASIRLSTLISGAALLRGARELVNFGKSTLELGSDITEVENVVDVSFGNMSKKAYDFAETATEKFGLAELSAKQYSGTMMAMLKSSGVAQSAAADMSTTLAGLAGDLASFYNIDTDKAFYKIRSGISGEIEPLKQLGINMSVANMEAYALAQGITTSYNAMSQAEKTMLRYNYLLSVTGDQQGDFARTAGTWANQVRLLSLNFQSLKAVIGQGLISAILPAVKALNLLLGKLMQVAEAFRRFMYTLAGKKLEGSQGGIIDDLSGLGDVSTGLDGVADAGNSATGGLDNATDSAKALKKALSVLPFDEINKLNEAASDFANTGAAGLGGSGVGNLNVPSFGGLDDAVNSLKNSNIPEEINKWAKQIRKAFLDKDWERLGLVVAQGLNKGLQKVYDVISWKNVGPKITEFTDAFTRSFNSLVNYLDWDLLGRTIGTGINTTVKTLNQLIEGINWKNLGMKFATGINGLADEVNWEEFGNLLGNKFMIGWNILYGFVNRLEFDKLGTDFAELLNGAFGRISFSDIATTLVGIVNGGFQSLYNFSITFKWDELASNVSSGLNTAFKTIKWEEAGAALNEFMSGIDEFLLKVAGDTPWEEFGKGVVEFLKQIKWSNHLDALKNVLETAIGGMFDGMEESGTAGKIASFLGKAFIAVKIADITGITTLANGIISFLIGRLKDKKNIERMTEAFKNIFGTSVSGASEAATEELGKMDGALDNTGSKASGTSTLLSGLKSILMGNGPIAAEAGFAVMLGHVNETMETTKNLKDDTVQSYGAVTQALKDLADQGIITNDQLLDMLPAFDTAKSGAFNFDDEFQRVITSLKDAGISSDTFKTALRNAMENSSVTSNEYSQKISDYLGVAESSIGNLSNKAQADFPAIDKAVSDASGNIETTTGTTWSNSAGFTSEALTSMQLDVSKGMLQTWKSVQIYMDAIYKSIKEGFGAAGKEFSEITSCMKIDTKAKLPEIADEFSGLGDRIQNALGNMYDIGRNAAQSFANGISSVHIPMPHISVSSSTQQSGSGYSYSMSSSVNWYANGGFPNAGEMFIARERGPELVGRMGNRNAVANNSQIIDGIRAGVFEAVVNAFESMGNQKGGDKEIHIHLDADAKKMFKVVREEGKKYQNSTGQPVFD